MVSYDRRVSKTTSSESVGFIGLGHLGLPIATNLLADGHAMRVYNRTASKADPLVEKGATRVSEPRDVATAGGVLFSVVSDDAALKAVCESGVIEALGAGGLHISVSTVTPHASREMAKLHEANGGAFVAAPIFARPEAAAGRKGSWCISGAADARVRAKAILEPLCSKVFDFGDDVGAANVVKLSGNFLLTAAIEAMAEASALAEKSGVPRAALLEMLTSTLFACPIYQGYSKRLIDADFEKVGFTSQMALKDMTLAGQTAAAGNVAMPILSLLRDRYLTQIANGRGDLDATVLSLGAAEDAGLDWF